MTHSLVTVHMFDALSLCMTRSDPSDLYPFDAEIDNTFHRLCKHDRNADLVNHSSVVDSSYVSYSESNCNTIFSNLVSY